MARVQGLGPHLSRTRLSRIRAAHTPTTSSDVCLHSPKKLIFFLVRLRWVRGARCQIRLPLPSILCVSAKLELMNGG